MQDGTYLYRNGELVNYGERWAYGYYVALRNGFTLTPQEADVLDIHADDLALNVAKVYPLVGVWTDTETGIVYVDPVEHIADRETAIDHATQRGEIAIWDAREDKEIRI